MQLRLEHLMLLTSFCRERWNASGFFMSKIPAVVKVVFYSCLQFLGLSFSLIFISVCLRSFLESFIFYRQRLPSCLRH